VIVVIIVVRSAATVNCSDRTRLLYGVESVAGGIMSYTPGTAAAAENGCGFDQSQAAALLEQATGQARRTFMPFGPPLLWAFRAVIGLVACGGCWLSVRGQQPYSGPGGWALTVAFVLVAVNIGWTAWVIRRGGWGVSGPAQRAKRAWIGATVVALAAAYAVMAPLYHSGTSHPVWGLYPASVPWLIVGLIGAAVATARRDWLRAGTCLAIALVAAAAGFGGPAGAWLIMGIGLGAVALGIAGFIARQQRRSAVWS
jgi:hypothetical protein